MIDKRKKSRQEPAPQSLLLSREIMKTEYLKALIWGHEAYVSPPEAVASIVNFCPNNKSVYVMVLKVDGYNTLEADFMGDVELLKFGITNVINEVLSRRAAGDCFCSAKGEWTAVLSMPQGSGIREAQHLFLEILREFRQCFHHLLWGGLSGEAEGYPAEQSGNLKELYREAEHTAGYVFFGGKGRLYLSEGQKDVDGYPLLEGKKIALLRRHLNPIDCRELFSLYPQLCVNSQQAVVQQAGRIRKLYEQYFLLLFGYALANSSTAQALAGMEQRWDALRSSGTLLEYNALLEEALLGLSKAAQSGVSLVERVCWYIQQNYTKPLSLTVLAERFGVSHGYLSRAFNREMGVSIVDYVSRVRIEAAIELMNTTGLKLYEISTQVGFLSQEQFSRTFKKITGKSPREFYASREDVK